MKHRLTNMELSGLISLKMCYDRQLTNPDEEDAVEDLLQKESKARGYSDWIEAMHDPNLSKIDVHTSHCCSVHGCKYGDSDCSVEYGKLEQQYPCYRCAEEEEEVLNGFNKAQIKLIIQLLEKALNND